MPILGPCQIGATCLTLTCSIEVAGDAFSKAQNNAAAPQKLKDYSSFDDYLKGSLGNDDFNKQNKDKTANNDDHQSDDFFSRRDSVDVTLELDDGMRTAILEKIRPFTIIKLQTADDIGEAKKKPTNSSDRCRNPFFF